MADVDHQNRTHLGFVLGVFYHQIVFGELESLRTIVDLRIFQAFGEGDFFNAIAKLIRSEFTRQLIALSGGLAFVVAASIFTDISENLVQGRLPNGPFDFSR